ncbi:hypothetical protein [Geothrix sp. 21YS21S-2]|uniref:bestrophin-like domain n=1 Tax=Geothrix sp. 21YS21S-2 TaxID=3068893 RepID=UPI0027BABF0B|nr:hypothetical protein [Geothrix sp. 21YS21S-2]
MRYLYCQVNELALALFMISAFTLAAVGTLKASYRFLPGLRFEPGSSDFGQIYGGAVGSIFALVFALVIVAVWQNYDKVSSIVDQEANALHNLYQNLEGYPPEFRDPIRAELKAYVRQVIDKEWTRITDGDQDPETNRMIAHLGLAFTTYKPAALGDLPLHQQQLQQLALCRSLRHDRIEGGETYLDASMWISLGMGSLILLAFSCLLNMGSLRQHHLMHATLGASLGLVFFLLLVYNYPFLGPGAISPAPLRMLLERFWV